MRFHYLLVLLPCFTLLTLGCDKEDGDDDVGDDDDVVADDDSAMPDDDTGDDDTSDDDASDDDSAGDDDTGDDDTTADQARWTFMVFMNGDNDLEYMVFTDLNELEQVGSGDDVHVLVQADRIPGYWSGDGDWTETRRYYIEPDSDMQAVTSPVVEELGELDMGDSTVLSDFLLWSWDNYPAEKMILILWDHGDGWSMRHNLAGDPQGFISSDDTSGSMLEISEGELNAALEPLVTIRGPLDIVGFDACNMACWEVGHALRDQALYMAASESTVDVEGFQYADALSLMRDVGANATARDVADDLARNAAEIGHEWTFSSVDLAGMDALAQAIDDLAAVVIADDSLEQTLLDARDASGAADFAWHDWYLDLRDFATLVSQESDPGLAAAGQAILDEMDSCVVGTYGNPPFAWTGGLTIYFDLTPPYVNAYSNGAGATWAQETRWDDLLQVMMGIN